MLFFLLQFNGRCELVVPVKKPAKSIWSTWMAGSHRSSVMDDELVVPVQRYTTRGGTVHSTRTQKAEHVIPLQQKGSKTVVVVVVVCATAYWRHRPGHHLSFSGTLKRARTSQTNAADLPPGASPVLHCLYHATLLFRRRLAETTGSFGKMAPSS
jgi:hypothetical protein